MIPKLFRNAILYGVSNGLSSIVPLILLPIITSILTEAEFGVYSMYILFFNVSTILGGLNIHGVISVNYVKMKPDDFSSLVSSCFLIPLIMFVFLCVLFCFFSDFVSSYFSLPREYLFISILVGCLNAYMLSFLVICQARNKVLDYVKTKVFQSFLEGILIVMFLVVLVFGLWGRIISQGVVIALCSLFSVLLLWRGGYLLFPPRKHFLKKAVKFGVPLLPHAVSGMLIMFVDRVLLAKLVDMDAVGIYMAGLQVSMIMLLLTESVNKAFAPWIYKKLSSKNFDESAKIGVVKRSYIYFVFLLCVSILLYAMNDILYSILVDEKFYEAKPLMLFLYVGFSFQGMYYIVTNYVLFREKTGILSRLSLLSGFLGGAVSYILIGAYGLSGAAVGFMLSNALLFSCVWIFSNRVYKMPWFAIFSRAY